MAPFIRPIPNQPKRPNLQNLVHPPEGEPYHRYLNPKRPNEEEEVVDLGLRNVEPNVGIAMW